MVFEKKSATIDLEAIKAYRQLSDEALVKKVARDAELAAIIKGEDQRFLLVIGPCSSDNLEAVMDYAHRLAALQELVKDRIFMVMRAYTSKPRTNGDGYKGLSHQPDAKGAPSLVQGLKAVRDLHYRIITETGLTTADEMLYPFNLAATGDLISYHAIGARSVEDQEHRFVASGIDGAVGLKNPTSGNLKVMMNAIYAAQHPKTFVFNGAEVATQGNDLAHAILRGANNDYGEAVPNYSYEHLTKVLGQYESMGLKHPFILVDTNHDNSGKHHEDQVRIVRHVMLDRAWNPKVAQAVRGFMIESYLEDGRQDQPEIYGKSITDPCLGWEKTEALINELYEALG